MPWGEVETEPEIDAWYAGLSDHDAGRVDFYVDLLAEQGVHLGEPYTRQLREKLRELRFYLDDEATRISYYIATGRRIVLLTVFTKTKPREASEIARAYRAMLACIEARHTAEDDA